MPTQRIIQFTFHLTLLPVHFLQLIYCVEYSPHTPIIILLLLLLVPSSQPSSLKLHYIWPWLSPAGLRVSFHKLVCHDLLIKPVYILTDKVFNPPSLPTIYIYIYKMYVYINIKRYPLVMISLLVHISNM